MSRIISPNGVSARPEFKISTFRIHLMGKCPCGVSLLLDFVPGMHLGTTCACKRVFTLRGLELDPENGQLGTAILINEQALLTPTAEELAKVQ